MNNEMLRLLTRGGSLTKDELERKIALLDSVRSLREAVLMNRAKVEHPPDVVVCWVNSSENRQNFFQALGWEIVTGDDTDIRSKWRKEDGHHRYGDTILYKISREQWEMWQTYGVLEGFDRLQGVKQTFEGEASKYGFATYEPRS